MDYYDKVLDLREERNCRIAKNNLIFHKLLERLLFLEKEIIIMAKEITEHSNYKSKSNRVTCYPQFQYMDESIRQKLSCAEITEENAAFRKRKFNKHKYEKYYPRFSLNNKFLNFSIFKRLSFEYIKNENGILKKKSLNNGARWSRIFSQTVKPRRLKKVISHKNSICKLYAEYHRTSKLIAEIGSNVIQFKCKNTVLGVLPCVTEKWFEHLPNRVQNLAITRGYSMHEISRLIFKTDYEFKTLEDKIDNLVKKFNVTFFYKNQSLSFSWTLEERKSVILSISKLTFWHITKPIDFSGNRKRYKKRIKHLDRQFLRDIHLKRFSRKILNLAKEINKLATQYKELKVSVNNTHKILERYSQNLLYGGCRGIDI